MSMVCGYDAVFGQIIHVAACPISRVVAAASKSDAAIVGHFETLLLTGDTAIRYRTGEKLRAAIVRFEETQQIEPGEWVELLEIPDDYDDPVAG